MATSPAVPLAPFPPNPTTLFISGGGFNIYHLGGATKYALEKLKAAGRQPDIYAGTSSGSFLALALVLGYQLDDLLSWSMTNYSTFASDLQISYWRAITTGALISQTGQRRFIKRLIESSPIYQTYFSHLSAKAVTFRDLATVTNARLVCNATLVTPPKPIFVLMSLETSPDLPVHWAVMASMSLLGYFQPVTAPNWFKGPGQTTGRYIDGGFMQDYLPAILLANHRAYYKNNYPAVELPISLDRSWGVLFNSDLQLENLQGSWSIIRLLKFFPSFIGIFYDNQINAEPYQLLQQRTWQIVQASRTSLPTAAEMQSDYNQAYAQAQAQGLVVPPLQAN